MSRVIQPNDTWSRVNQLEKRIANLERVSQLGNANITDGFLQVSDDTGNVMVKLGLIDEALSIYGIAVADLSGVLHLISPPSDSSGSFGSTSNTSWTSTGIECSATIGPSGLARVGCFATIQTSADANSAGLIGVVSTANGGAPIEFGRVSVGAATGATATVGQSKIISGLTPGINLFVVNIITSGVGSGRFCSFTNIAIDVAPL